MGSRAARCRRHPAHAEQQACLGAKTSLPCSCNPAVQQRYRNSSCQRSMQRRKGMWPLSKQRPNDVDLLLPPPLRCRDVCGKVQQEEACLGLAPQLTGCQRPK